MATTIRDKLGLLDVVTSFRRKAIRAKLAMNQVNSAAPGIAVGIYALVALVKDGNIEMKISARQGLCVTCREMKKTRWQLVCRRGGGELSPRPGLSAGLPPIDMKLKMLGRGKLMPFFWLHAFASKGEKKEK